MLAYANPHDLARAEGRRQLRRAQCTAMLAYEYPRNAFGHACDA